MSARFLQRRYPSANGVWLDGTHAVLVDTGFGSDVDELLASLPGPPALIVNTHFHTDHVGGNHALQRRFRCPIAASPDEAASVNRRDVDACERHWLVQPVELYTVERVLHDGDAVETGGARWTVVATPGHTPGHLSLHCPESRTVVLGDALHAADIGWLSPREPDSVDRTAETIERIAGLDATTGFSGHGPAIADLPAALDRARRRLAAWRRDPEQVGWHACKRVFSHALMLKGGMVEADLGPFLLACPWFVDHARLVFHTDPAALVQPLLREMLRADAAYRQGGVLQPRADYRAVSPRPIA